MSGLKECPFCGAPDPRSDRGLNEPDNQFVECNHCPAAINGPNAMETWNRRAPGLAEGKVPDSECVKVPVGRLLAIRDALIRLQPDDAYHELYNITKWSDPYKPWVDWEMLLAASEEKP